MTRSDELDGVRERVRARYTQAAAAVTAGGVASSTWVRRRNRRAAVRAAGRASGRAGFTAITITPTHQVAGGLHSAIVQATKPQHTEGR